MGLGRQDVIAGLAPIAQDGPDDQAFDHEEDDDGDQEDDRVELADLRALLGHGDRRVEALDDPLRQAERVATADQDDGGGSDEQDRPDDHGGQGV